MTQLSRALVCCCAALILTICADAAWGQTVPVYVSGGQNIYKVSGGTVTTVLTVSGANFESLAIGPDNVDKSLDGLNADHPFLLYACDTAGNTIIRFDPTATGTPTTIPRQQVYSGGTVGIPPECGRSSSTGDFFITNKNGSGVFKLTASALANEPFSVSPIPTTASPVGATFPATMTGRGLTQKNNGDLLIVDNADSQVLRSPYATTNCGPGPFGTLTKANGSCGTPFIGSNLNSPVGIARFSTGEIFVANSVLGSGKNAFSPVAHFKSDGSPASTCPGLSFKSSQTPAFLASSETDTLFLVTTANSSGTLWSWSPTQVGGGCGLMQVATLPNLISVSGVAVTAGNLVPVAITQTVSGTTKYDFHSSVFDFTATSCGSPLTVTAYPLSLATVQSMIVNAYSGSGLTATPLANLGEAGYELVYVAHWDPAFSNCQSEFIDFTFPVSVFGLYDTTAYSNPRMLKCDNGFIGAVNTKLDEPTLNSSTVCQRNDPTVSADPQLLGVYPIGGIPEDGGVTIGPKDNSILVPVNESVSGAAEPGQFCGFQNPLLNPTDPGYPAVFPANSKNTLSVKFKLATASGNCQNGPYISDAIALLSVAQIEPVFNPCSLSGSGVVCNSGSTSVGNATTLPLFNSGNNQYQFTLTISTLAPGTYTLTVTFLTDNTNLNDPTSSPTILFKIK